MTELTEDRATLVQVAQMAIGEIPRTYSEFCSIVWEAFRLGRHYEHMKQNEAKDQP